MEEVWLKNITSAQQKAFLENLTVVPLLYVCKMIIGKQPRATEFSSHYPNHVMQCQHLQKGLI